jgi:hypothetical protein
MQLSLVGFTVMRCSVDYQFRLDLARPAEAVRGQVHASVIVAGPFEYLADGTARQLDAEQHPEELGPALRLFLRTVEAASIADDGSLHLQFSGQVALRVPSMVAYEAWEVTDGDGQQIICMPGGALATWPARPTAPNPLRND